MKQIKLLLSLAAIFALTFTTGCITSKSGSGSAKTTEAAPVPAAEPVSDYFAAYDTGTRIYLIGTPEGDAKYQSGGGVPIAKTIIGKYVGADGSPRTIVAEAGKDGEELQNRLISTFEAKTGASIQ